MRGMFCTATVLRRCRACIDLDVMRQASFTFVSTANAFVLQGARPAFAALK